MSVNVLPNLGSRRPTFVVSGREAICRSVKGDGLHTNASVRIESFSVGRSRKDNRRRITINGVVYRYTVSPDDGFVALSACPENARGQRLWVKFGYHDDWQPVGEGAHRSAGHRLILPRVVRLAILVGLRKGWNPALTKPGLFRVLDGDNLLPPEEGPRFSD